MLNISVLLSVFNYVTVNFDHDKGTLVALLDISTAFDTIDHEKLVTLVSMSGYIYRTK